MKTFFFGHMITPKKGLHDLCRGRFVPKNRTKPFGQVWGNLGKNPSHTKNLPTPAPMSISDV